MGYRLFDWILLLGVGLTFGAGFHAIGSLFRYLGLPLVLLVAAASVQAQECSASVYCPPMNVYRVGIGRMICDEEPMTVTVKWPSGKVLEIECVLPETPVRGRLARWMVDAVTGVGEKDGAKIVLHLPAEPVRLRRGGITALAITATGTLEIDGKIGVVTVWFPDCLVQRLGFGRLRAAALTAPGKVVFQ